MFGGLSMLTTEKTAILVVLTGVFLGLSGFVYGCSAIRCPDCGARWLWLGVSGKSAGHWLPWLLNQSNCPKCKGANSDKSI